MNSTVKVAAAQISPVFLDKNQTVEKACLTIREAANNGAKLIVFPEAFIPGYPDWVWLIPNSKGAELNKLFTELVENSVSVPDNSTELLCKAAKENSINVVIGMNERNTESSNSSIFNSMLFIDDQGNIIGKHRKLIPTGGERLIWGQGDGSDLQSYETLAGLIGGLICWENYMPLARTAMYETGMQILAAPTWDKSPNWQSSMQHIAREGRCWVVGCGNLMHTRDLPPDLPEKTMMFPEDDWINPGDSVVISPDGEIAVGPMRKEAGILYCEVDLEKIGPAKRTLDVAGHYSRPDIFTLHVNTKPQSPVQFDD